MATPPSDQVPPAPANATPPGPPAQRLKPCPFCGGEAEFERLGTGRVSCIVVCYGCGARHESGDSGAASGTSWNRRHTEPPAPRGDARRLVDEAIAAVWDIHDRADPYRQPAVVALLQALEGRATPAAAVDRPLNVKRELEAALRYQVPELRTVPMYVESCAKCAKAEQDLRQIKEALTAFRIYGNSTDPGLMVAAILGRAAEVVALEEWAFVSGGDGTELMGFGFCAGCGITMGNGCACKDKRALATVTFRGTEPELSAFKARLGRLWPAALAPDHETHRARAVALMQLTNVHDPIPYDRLAAIAGEPANTLPREVRAIAVELYSRRLQVAEAAIGDVESARRLYRGVFTCATCDGTGRELIDCDGSAGYRPCPKGCPRP